MKLVRFLSPWLLFGLIGAYLFVGPTLALAAPTPTPAFTTIDRATAKANTYTLAQDDINNYAATINNCDTPSLECLVHNIYKFLMIETYYNIKGDQVGDKTKTGAMARSGTNVAYVGAISGLSSLINDMYQRPIASSTVYVADVLNSVHIAQPAYAQGLGFASLNPILGLWKTFRNIAYLFYVVIFIVIGFMIIFRAKVGQAAITAQQAIPSIIISLILVTFSYAIAGFIIDLMYLTMILITGLFGNMVNNQNMLSFNIFNLAGFMFTGVTHWKEGISGSGGNIISASLRNLGAGKAVTTIVGFVGGLTLTVVLAVAVLIGVFKLFFELLRSYATAVIYIVAAPLLLMLGAIPGQNAFMQWFKALIGNLLPFPTVLVVMVMYKQFSDKTLLQQQGGFMPPFLFGGGQSGVIAYLMGLALVLAMPEIVKHVRESVAGKGGFGEMVVGAAMNRGKIAAVPSAALMAQAGYTGYRTLKSLRGAFGATAAISNNKGLRAKEMGKYVGMEGLRSLGGGWKLGTKVASMFGLGTGGTLTKTVGSGLDMANIDNIRKRRLERGRQMNKDGVWDSSGVDPMDYLRLEREYEAARLQDKQRRMTKYLKKKRKK